MAPEVFFDELFAPFYVQLRLGFHKPENFQPGQVFFATVGFTGENRMYWRPVNYDALTQTEASEFNAVGGAPDLFRRRFPLFAPPLASDEEFLVVRGKRRPVVLLSKPLGNLGSTASYRHHCVVLPRFGLIKGPSGAAKYSPEIVARMRALEFPDVFFTPAETPHLEYAADVPVEKRAVYAQAEAEARVARRGLWRDPNAIAPWDFRHPRSEAVSSAVLDGGRIIGNRNSRIYHMPNCPDYSRVAERNRIYFDTPEEAERAGFREARNCR